MVRHAPDERGMRVRFFPGAPKHLWAMVLDTRGIYIPFSSGRLFLTGIETLIAYQLYASVARLDVPPASNRKDGGSSPSGSSNLTLL